MTLRHPLSLGLLALLTIVAPTGATDSIEKRGGFSNLRVKAEAGESVHVVFLGGSITQNAKGHSAMVPAWLEEHFPKAAFTFTNAGLSSTCSVTGAFRFHSDVLAKGPVDLLIVEFAVNDDQDAAHGFETATRGLEGIIRQTRSHNPSADILSVHFVNPGMLELLQNGRVPTSIAAHEAVAKHYQISSVNVAAALASEIASGEMTWTDYGGTHPKPDGYRFASELIAEAISMNWDGEPAPHPSPDAPLDPGNYGKAVFVDPQEASWLGGWTFAPVGKESLPVGSIRRDYERFSILRADEPGDMLYFDFEGRAIGAFVLAGPDAGIVETRIDGGEWVQHDLFHKHSRGLNYPRSVIFADDLEPGAHQLALRIHHTKSENSRGHAAAILFFEVNR